MPVTQADTCIQAVVPDLRIDRERIANMRRAQQELWQAIARSHDAIKDTRKLLTEIEPREFALSVPDRKADK